MSTVVGNIRKKVWFKKLLNCTSSNLDFRQGGVVC